MSTTIFMNLELPTVTVTPGPEWASELNTALESIDSHDHSSGKGTKVTPAGLNINADLEFNNNNVTELKSSRYQNQDATLSGNNDIRCLYVSGNNLYYNNESGTAVQITSGSGLNASSLGGIGGDYGTSDASVTYNNSSKKYFFYQNSGITAFMDTGAITIRENVSSANGVTIGSPTSLGASYDLTLPTALPASGTTAFLTVDSSGQMGSLYKLDNDTIIIDDNTIQMAPVTRDHLAEPDLTSDGTDPGLGGLATSVIIGDSIVAPDTVLVFDEIITLTTSGRPVFIGFDTRNRSDIELINNSGAGLQGDFEIIKGAASSPNGITLGGSRIISNPVGATSNQLKVPTSSFYAIDYTDLGTAGVRTYSVLARLHVGDQFVVHACRLIAFEL